MQRALFRSRNRFQLETLPPIATSTDVLLDDEQFRVRARAFDHHGLPSYAFAFEEHTHLNGWKSRLDELGLPTGPWLTDLKRRVRAGEPDESTMRRLAHARRSRTRLFRLASLSIAYPSWSRPARLLRHGCRWHEDNRQALSAFLREADVAYIQAVFLDEDCAHAARKAHLTASQAGRIAREAAVKVAVPFHFSTRYFPDEQRLAQSSSMAIEADVRFACRLDGTPARS